MGSQASTCSRFQKRGGHSFCASTSCAAPFPALLLHWITVHPVEPITTALLARLPETALSQMLSYSAPPPSTEVISHCRDMLERSNAALCPSVAYQLAGAKKVQQDLASTDVLQRFLDDQSDVELLQACFAGTLTCLTMMCTCSYLTLRDVCTVVQK